MQTPLAPSLTSQPRCWLAWLAHGFAAAGLAFGQLAAFSTTAAAQAPALPPSLSALREGFAHPPPQARLRCYWWWLNGHTDKPTITHDLEEMKAKGFGGALLVDADGSSQGGNQQVPAGPTFGSVAWIDLYTHALREADRLGLEITLNINSGWNLGGPGVTPEESSKLLTWSRTAVSGGSPVTLHLPAPPAKNAFYREIAVLAYPLHNPATIATPAGLPGLRERSVAVETGFSMPESAWMLSAAGTPAGGSGLSQLTESDRRLGEREATPAGVSSNTKLPDAKLPDAAPRDVQDLSTHVTADGTLTWTPPPGTWEVLRIGYTNSDARVSTSSGAWQGRALDHLSRTAFDSYWNRVVEPLLAAAKPYRSLRYLATDSWELGGTNWTETFAAEFKARRGYDPVPWLPVVAGRVLGTPDESARFLTDLRRTVADLVVANHFDRFAERAAEHNLGVQAESGGPHGAPIDALETFRHASVPQTEFWSQNPHRNTDVQRFFPKQAASAAHIYGQHFVAAEGETSINEQWTESLATDLKPAFDMAVTEGLNRLVWHEFTSSPAATGLPGQEYFAGTHLNPKVTWWNAGGAFFDYLNRVQFLMQQGTAVNDVLYFYGDNIPNFVRLKADDPAHVLPGYDYDVTDEDALLHTIHSEEGHLRGPAGPDNPGGLEWKVLALPSTGRVSLEILKRLEVYVRNGGIVAGVPPSSATGLVSAAAQAESAQLIRKIWANCAAGSHHVYGQGQVFCTADTRNALTALGILPDVAMAASDELSPKPGSTSDFDYVHRRIGQTEVYFVRNGSDHASVHEVLFRAGGKSPELWDAVSGQSLGTPPHHRLPSGQVQVSLTLALFGSAIVLFSDSPTHSSPSLLAGSTRTEPLTPLHPWSVSFQPGRGAPVTPVETTDLKSWTEWPQPGVRFFSGTAIYRAEVLAPAFRKGEPVWLHFDGLREIARVRLNGKPAGTVWAMPLELRVDSLLLPGRNRLEIEVTNLWPNRIIGDLQPGVTERFTETNITSYKADSPLLPSGILGPVSWKLSSSASTP